MEFLLILLLSLGLGICLIWGGVLGWILVALWFFDVVPDILFIIAAIPTAAVVLWLAIESMGSKAQKSPEA